MALQPRRVVSLALIGAACAYHCASASLANVEELTLSEVAKALQDRAAAGIQKLLYKAGPGYTGVAGMHQFSETWARDLQQASIGLLARPSWEVEGTTVA